jgi:hypothetical protein
VHEHQPGARVGDGAAHRVVEAQPADVVDDVRPRVEGGARDLGLDRVDRDHRRGPPLAHGPHHRDHPRPLLVRGHRPGVVRPRALPAHVDPVRPSSSSRSACRTAASSVACRPPSLKLSGVTLTTPSTNGRSSVTTRAASRQTGGPRVHAATDRC